MPTYGNHKVLAFLLFGNEQSIEHGSRPQDLMPLQKEIYDEATTLTIMTRKEGTPFIPIVVTLVAGICWALFMLLHIVFWSSDFDLFQNIVILLLSIVVAGCIMGLVWVSWIFRRA